MNDVTRLIIIRKSSGFLIKYLIKNFTFLISVVSSCSRYYYNITPFVSRNMLSNLKRKDFSSLKHPYHIRVILIKEILDAMRSVKNISFCSCFSKPSAICIRHALPGLHGLAYIYPSMHIIRTDKCCRSTIIRIIASIRFLLLI